MQTTGRNPEDINEQQIAPPISMGNSCNYYVAIVSSKIINTMLTNDNHRQQARWVSVLTTFPAPPQILAASTVFFCPISRNEEMMGDGFLWCYRCRFVLNSKRLLSMSCNKQGHVQ